jgi:hypothetical protein
MHPSSTFQILHFENCYFDLVVRWLVSLLQVPTLHTVHVCPVSLEEFPAIGNLVHVLGALLENLQLGLVRGARLSEGTQLNGFRLACFYLQGTGCRISGNRESRICPRSVVRESAAWVGARLSEGTQLNGFRLACFYLQGTGCQIYFGATSTFVTMSTYVPSTWTMTTCTSVVMAKQKV